MGAGGTHEGTGNGSVGEIVVGKSETGVDTETEGGVGAAASGWRMPLGVTLTRRGSLGPAVRVVMGQKTQI